MRQTNAIKQLGRVYMELKRRPFSAHISEIYFIGPKSDRAENWPFISSYKRGPMINLESYHYLIRSIFF